MAIKRKYEDDVFDSLDSDIDKIRVRHRQYISYSGTKGAYSVAMEGINNALDECRTPRSPGDKIHIEFDELSGILTVEDNGRGIPTDILEKVFTSLNMGSNINTSNKAGLKTETLGQNGTGSLALCGLAEHFEVISYRGGNEGIAKSIVFKEGKKVNESTMKCPERHGLTIHYKPSKVMGKDTKIIWDDIHKDLLNLQYMNQKKIKIDSIYIDSDGAMHEEKYKPAPFEDILDRNDPDKVMSQKFIIQVNDDNVVEELDGENVKRYISMDVAFMFTSSLSPYIDSFSNSNNTVDNGDHLEAALEAICRFFQTATKNSMSDKEKERLDIKWDDIRNGLSLAVALRTNYERLYTGQTKHKVVSPEIKKVLIALLLDKLNIYFQKNPTQLKEIINIVKINAKARREGDKVRTAVVKNALTNWSSYKMKNYDPCTNKGKEYKELFIIEGD